jgi:hypothetical protein
MKMTMRYAHLSPAFLSAEVSLLDPPAPPVVAASLAPSVEAPLEAKTDSAVVGTISAVEPESDPPPSPTRGGRRQRARKGQSESFGERRDSELPRFVRKFGSSGWIRTSNPPVNSGLKTILLRVAGRGLMLREGAEGLRRQCLARC